MDLIFWRHAEAHVGALQTVVVSVQTPELI